jgi:hypothetical protein
MKLPSSLIETFLIGLLHQFTMRINQSYSHHFTRGKETIDAVFFFTTDTINNSQAEEGYVYLVIGLKNDSFYAAKPKLILLQPLEVIEKIVEREIKQFLEHSEQNPQPNTSPATIKAAVSRH